MTFDEYLIGKHIDSATFKSTEEPLWQNWKNEFEQLHPKSFTAQKLYLINPIRRKYPLKEIPISNTSNESEKAKSVMKAKPVFKSKPKIN